MLLESLFAEIKELPGDISGNVMLLKGFVKADNLKRLTYCTPDGTAYTTDNVIADLSYREFFKRGLQGKSTITGVLTDAIRPDTDEKIIIDYILYSIEKGCSMQGMEDPEVKYLNVLVF